MRGIEVTLQLSTHPPAVAPGGVMFWLTTTVEEAVHPLAAVAVTVNVPGVVTLIEAVDRPLLHSKVDPEDAVAVNVAEVAIQVNV